VAAAGTAMLIRVAPRLGLLDEPGARSSHVRVTPRGGGIAIVAGAAAGLAAFGPPLAGAPGILLAGAAAMALVGLADDRYRLPVAPRLALQVLAAGTIAWATGGLPRLPLPSPLDVALGPAAVPAATLWIVAIVNFFNFMDGIDGLAGAQAVVTGIGVAVVAWSDPAAAIGAAAAGGAAGFLVFNRPPARVFMGDSGSLALGYTFASLPLLAAPDVRPAAVFWMVMSLWLFVADAALTLVARIARGEAFFAAHRDHLYQRLVRSGLGHAPVAFALAAGALALTVAASVLYPFRAAAPWGLLAAALVLVRIEAAVASRRAIADAR
jgi:Fuc2NAc and GlcNAc transferase